MAIMRIVISYIVYLSNLLLLRHGVLRWKSCIIVVALAQLLLLVLLCLHEMLLLHRQVISLLTIVSFLLEELLMINLLSVVMDFYLKNYF